MALDARRGERGEFWDAAVETYNREMDDSAARLSEWVEKAGDA